jgi:hypothetical protein
MQLNKIMKYITLFVVALVISCGAGPEIEKTPDLDGLKTPNAPAIKHVTYSVTGSSTKVELFALFPAGTIKERVELPWSRQFTCTYCDLFIDVCKVAEDIPSRSDISIKIIVDGESVGILDKRRDDCVEASYKTK